MREEQSVEEKVYRMFHGNNYESSFNNHNKNIMIPVIPYDSNEAYHVLRITCPSEDIMYSNDYDVVVDDEDRDPRNYSTLGRGRESDMELLRRGGEEEHEHEDEDDDDIDYVENRDECFNVTVEEFINLDRMRIGLNSIDEETTTEDDNQLCCVDKGEEEEEEEDLPLQKITEISPPLPPNIISILSLDDDILVPLRNEGMNQHQHQHQTSLFETRSLSGNFEFSDKLLLSRQDSMESSVSSIFSTTSSIVSTPSILRLKARKRILERFLSDNNIKLGENIPIIEAPG